MVRVLKKARMLLLLLYNAVVCVQIECSCVSPSSLKADGGTRKGMVEDDKDQS